MSIRRLVIWILTLLVGVAGFLCAVVDGYEVAVDVLKNGETAVIGFPYGAGAYVISFALTGWVLKSARRASPWQTSVYLVSALAILLVLYEYWHFS